MPQPAAFELEVRFYELDPYGHVNHATYLQYFEAARVAWLDSIGQGLDLLQEAGAQLIVIAVSTRFVAPALLHDILRIETGMVASRRVRAQWAQRAMRGEDLIACQRVNFAVTNTAGRPIRIPESLAGAMAQFELGEQWAAEDLPDLTL